MNCFRVKKLLSEYIDHYLDFETKSTVEVHLSTCDKCNSIYKELITLEDLLCSIKPVEATEAEIKESLEEIYKAISPDYGYTDRIINFPNLSRRGKTVKILAVAVSIILTLTVYFYIQHNDIKPVVTEIAKQDKDSLVVSSSEKVLSEQTTGLIHKQETDLVNKKDMEIAFWVNYQIKTPTFVHAETDANIKFGKVIHGIGNVGLSHRTDGSDSTEIYEPLTYLNDLNNDIQSKIKDYQGNVLRVELGTQRPYIEAEIPVVNFEAFSNFMDKIGDTQKIIPHNIHDGSLSAIDRNNDQFVQIRITIDVPE